jgi:predicted transcriptional regulator
MSSWKRGFLEIIAEILDCLIENPMKKTHITFKCNLDSRAVTKYLSIMTEVELVEKSSEDSSFYVITQKGIKYRNQFNSFAHMIETDLSKITEKGKTSKDLLEHIKVKIRS